MDQNNPSTTHPEGEAPAVGRRAPVYGWGDTLLACLPFLLIFLFDVLPMLLVAGGLLTWEDAVMQRFNIILRVLLLAGGFLLVLFLAWRRRWPAGLATWYLFFGLAPLLLAGYLLSMLSGGSPNFVLSQGMTVYVMLPLVVAVLLYFVTRRDPLGGLLATLPLLYFLWNPNMEFVPDRIEVAVKLPSLALFCLAIAFLLRRGDWRAGLYAILAMNLAVGALFSYAGIYYGGTLPFVAPGPSLVEVARSLVPQYLATSAILLGPLFAWKFRQAGRSGGQAGRIGYHLALAGLLLVILANLASLSLTMEPPSPYFAPSSRSVLITLILLGLGVYLLGVFFLYREFPFKFGRTGWVEGFLLPVLPLAIPVIFMLPFITWMGPVSSLYGVPLLWALPHALSLSVGLLWLGLSVWVVTRGEEWRDGGARQVGFHPPDPQNGPVETGTAGPAAGHPPAGMQTTPT